MVNARSYIATVGTAFKSRSPDSDVRVLDHCVFSFPETFLSPNDTSAAHVVIGAHSKHCVSTLLSCSLGNLPEKVHSYTTPFLSLVFLCICVYMCMCMCICTCMYNLPLRLNHSESPYWIKMHSPCKLEFLMLYKQNIWFWGFGCSNYLRQSLYDSHYTVLVMGKSHFWCIKSRFRQCQADQVFLEKTSLITITWDSF